MRAFKPDPGLPLFEAVQRRFLSVTELSELVKRALDARLGALWVRGEISNLRAAPSGHLYFTLKDDKCQIAAVMFRRQGAALRFRPENGMAVLCLGRVSVYSTRGDLQFYVDEMEAHGKGALYLAFEQLKARLGTEGLFSPERKKSLPFLPSAVGIVTSDRGAALHDMLRILRNRYPERRVVIRPVRVQGDGAAEEIAAGIEDLNRLGAVDVIIVGRGGGSLEDLWAFNEEAVARAIFASTIPVVSAVGHEIDFTIADFVADCRAPTPTAAAEMVVPRKSDLLEQLGALRHQLIRDMALVLEMSKESLAGLARRLADPTRRLRENQQRLDDLSTALIRALRERLRRRKDRLGQGAGRLAALSPLAVLERGYSITHRLPEERIVKDADSLAVGDQVRITFAAGKAFCRIESKE